MLQKVTIPAFDLEQILNKYDLGQVINTSPLLSSGNITYLVETSQGTFILRLCPEGFRFRSKEEIEAELELINYLNQNSFPVSKPITQKDGQTIVEWQGKFGYLRSYDESEAILNPSLGQVVEVGKLLGWFHTLTENWQPKSTRTHIFSPQETLKNLEEDKELILGSNFRDAGKFFKKVEQDLKALNFPDDLPEGMLHEDLGKRHVLWNDGNVSCVLDFDRSYYGKLIWDLGQALRGWCITDNNFDWNNGYFKAFIEGYEEKRQLTKAEKDYLLAAVKFAVIERAISFCLRFITGGQDKEDEDYAYRSIFEFLDKLDDNFNQ